MRVAKLGRGSLLAAVPTPIVASGSIGLEGLRHLVSWLGKSVVAGVSVGSPPGRGAWLTPDQRSMLLATWREGLSDGKLLVAAVGAPPEVRRPLEIFETARVSATLAAESGADALLVEPPGSVRSRPERDRLILEYHSEIALAGLPLLLSYQREASGGIAYGPDVLAQLLARPEVLGLRIATIDGISAFQQVEALTREFAPDKLVVTGEERFLGYSLMSGADAALVAIGAVYPVEVAELLQAHFEPDPARFLGLSRKIDALARPIFRAPIDGATERILRILLEPGTLPTQASP